LFKGLEGDLTAYIALRDQNTGRSHRDWWSGSTKQPNKTWLKASKTQPLDRRN